MKNTFNGHRSITPFWHDFDGNYYSLTELRMSGLLKNLEDQIHLHNILSCISEVEEVADDISFDHFVQDEEARMMIYRNLIMLGIEAFNLQKNINPKRLDLTSLASMKNADFMNRLGKEHYSIFCFISNDLPYLKRSIEQYIAKVNRDSASRSDNRSAVVA